MWPSARTLLFEVSCKKGGTIEINFTWQCTGQPRISYVLFFRFLGKCVSFHGTCIYAVGWVWLFPHLCIRVNPFICIYAKRAILKKYFSPSRYPRSGWLHFFSRKKTKYFILKWWCYPFICDSKRVLTIKVLISVFWNEGLWENVVIFWAYLVI